jgi:hypothetical protein
MADLKYFVATLMDENCHRQDKNGTLVAGVIQLAAFCLPVDRPTTRNLKCTEF